MPAQSMEKDIGCRFMDKNRFCYVNKAAALWCAADPTNKYCNDAGAVTRNASSCRVHVCLPVWSLLE